MGLLGEDSLEKEVRRLTDTNLTEDFQKMEDDALQMTDEAENELFFP